MYKRILIATDGSELAFKAIAHGIGLAKTLGAEIVAVTVTSPDIGSAIAGPMVIIAPPDAAAHADEYAEKSLAVVAKYAGKEGVACSGHHERHAMAHEAIIDCARANGCDLIVMGSHGHGGWRSLILGSVAQKVLALSTIPVLICR